MAASAWVAIVTVLCLSFYVWTGIAAGRARGRHGVEAPSMTGPPEFERAVRVQANTLEWIVVFLPAMWLFSAYVNAYLAAALGGVWIIGRVVYMQAYMRDPKSRSAGFAIQGLATLAALVGALVGALGSLISSGAPSSA